MGRPKICPYCGESIKKDSPNIPYKGRSYHTNCFNRYVKITKTEKDNKLSQKTKRKTNKRPKIELKDNLSEEDYKEKKQYYNYLHSLIEGDLSAKIYVLTEEYIKKYNFTYRKMYDTLFYLNEILKKKLTGDIIGIIPYYYTEAEEYNKKLSKIERDNKDINLTNMYQTKTIYVNLSKQKNKELIDIEQI